MTKLSSPWTLLRGSLRDFRAHWQTYLLIVGVVALPASILSLMLSQDASLSAYVSFANIFMSVALIYAIAKIGNGEDRPKLGESYYGGSAKVLPFMLVSLSLAIMAIPAFVGLVIIIVGLTPTAGTAVSVTEVLLLGLVGLIVALPSWWWLTRFLLAFYAVMREDRRPVVALKHARRLTLGRFWAVLGRLLFLVLVALALLAIAYLPTALLGLVWHESDGLTVFYQFVFSLIGLPILNLYLYKLYLDLEKSAELT